MELILADGSPYPEKGKVELVSGQFDNSVGAIPFRAVFPNTDRVLRSGNTGRIRIPIIRAEALTVPQEATFNLPDQNIVYTLRRHTKLASKHISISHRSGTR